MKKLFLEDTCCFSGKTEIIFKLNTETEAKARVLRMGQVMLPGLAAQKSKAAPQFHRNHTFPESESSL